jgi:hypothetical protein
MPAFFTQSTNQDTIADGTYILKIVDAKNG